MQNWLQAYEGQGMECGSLSRNGPSGSQIECLVISEWCYFIGIMKFLPSWCDFIGGSVSLMRASGFGFSRAQDRSPVSLSSCWLPIQCRILSYLFSTCLPASFLAFYHDNNLSNLSTISMTQLNVFL